MIPLAYDAENGFPEPQLNLEDTGSQGLLIV